jgi:superfamily II DNA or RNA helicase
MELSAIQNKYGPGALVHVRQRDWVVLPSPNENLLLLKPLDGADDETTGIYLPLAFEEDTVKSAEFPAPAVSNIGAFSSARLLYNAARLSLRNTSGPFRSMGKLSFRPRAYQMVPLIMALRQNYPIRLLIADDVGVGKTIEAGIILKELLERRDVKSFAVITPPHLCEQWQEELRDKFGIDAVIIRSNTQARLDREIHDDTAVYNYYKYQVISIDYIKSPQRRQVFIQNCPELVIVDEAHTCAAHGVANSTQQQRHKLVEDIITRNPDRHLILLTATPHSGKQEQFNSLLGLLAKEYEFMDLPGLSREERRELAKFFVQRRRADVEKWSGQDTPFPDRDSSEIEYDLSPAYEEFYYKARKFALGLTAPGEAGGDRGAIFKGRRKLRYWAALALLRGVMSSPAAGVEMLKNRINKSTPPEEIPFMEDLPNPLIDEDFGARDFSPSAVLEQTPWSDKERSQLNELASELERLTGAAFDFKAQKTVQIVSQWLKQKFQPVIFCRFIATAIYLGEILKQELTLPGFAVDVQVVTGEDPDEVRKARVEDMKNSEYRVLVATDCLSEGINLQDLFTAVLHYDLPWNPNRLEQREGRIDRYGQRAPLVKTYLLYSSQNPMDKIVFTVLLKKVRQIRSDIGISIPFPEDNQSFMDAVFQEVVAQPDLLGEGYQRTFDFDDFEPVNREKLAVTKAIDAAAKREKESRSIFAQNAIKADEIENDLLESDQATGTPEDVEAFVAESLPDLLGVQISRDKNNKGYTLYTVNLPGPLTGIFLDKHSFKVSFHSPTPEGYLYIGRNHAFVENLCRYLLGRALSGDDSAEPARAAVIKCSAVAIKTTLLLLRVRNVIEEKQSGHKLVAEEMIVWGYKGSASRALALEAQEVDRLIKHAVSSVSLSAQAAAHILEAELNDIAGIKGILDDVAYERARVLVEAHERFRSVVGGKRYKIVEPVLPVDFIGIYILLPDGRELATEDTEKTLIIKSEIRNPKFEIRNSKQIQNSND